MFTTCWYRWVSLCDKHLSHCHAFSLCDHHVTQKTQSNIFPLTACLNCFSAEWNCDRSWWPKNTCVPLTLFSRQRYTYWSRRTRFRASTRSSGWRCHPSSLTAPPPPFTIIPLSSHTLSSGRRTRTETTSSSTRRGWCGCSLRMRCRCYRSSLSQSPLLRASSTRARVWLPNRSGFVLSCNLLSSPSLTTANIEILVTSK